MLRHACRVEVAADSPEGNDRKAGDGAKNKRMVIGRGFLADNDGEPA
jgi:hypothetical protein